MISLFVSFLDPVIFVSTSSNEYFSKSLRLFIPLVYYFLLIRYIYLGKYNFIIKNGTSIILNIENMKLLVILSKVKLLILN